MNSRPQKLILKAIKDFRVNYQNLYTISDVESYREITLIRFAQLIDDIHPIVPEIDDPVRISADDPGIRTEITKKIAQINRYARYRKIQIADSVLLNAENDALRYRLTRDDIELLIAHKNKKREINCYVIDGNTPYSVSDFLENIAKNGQRRTQLIFKIESTDHWSTMDIQREENGVLKIFFLDAIGHTTNLPKVVDFCDRHQFELTQAMGGIQKDFASCSVFCTDHAFHMSRISDLHEQLNLVRTADSNTQLHYHVQPIDLPPALLKNAQSTSFIDQYLNKHQEQVDVKINPKGQTLKEYAESHHVTVNSQKIYSAVVCKQTRYRNKINHEKGYPGDPQYSAKITANAEQAIAKATLDILDIKVDFESKTTANSIAFYYQALLLQVEELRTKRLLRDAQTILNLRQTPPALQNAIGQKQKEICLAMQKRITAVQAVESTLKSREAHLLEQRVKMLIPMNFDKHLLVFKEKTAQMQKKSKSNPEYIDAAKKAEQFYVALETAKLKFLQAELCKTTEELKPIFRNECQKALQEAKSALEHHREWNGAIKCFVIEVLSFLTAGLFSNSFTKFSRTDSVKKIDHFDADLNAATV